MMKMMLFPALLLLMGAMLTDSSPVAVVKPVASINITITTITNHSSIVPRDVPHSLLLSIQQSINRSSIAPLLNLLNMNQQIGGNNESINETEYCERQLKRLIDTRTSEGGCIFNIECDYDPFRYPALLLRGACKTPYCGKKPQKQCIIDRKRLPVLRYTKLNIEEGKGGYSQRGSSSNDNGSYQWIRSTYQYNSDCRCSNGL
uniref:Uncharacterized protein n=1 Tax=Amphimedon queenslandica TaxID=400682 RepID=A0A1X7UKQ4_AMPQE